MLFDPHLTPLQILERGAFGKSYFHLALPEDLVGLGLPDAVIADNSRAPDWSQNAYGVKSGMSLAEWERKGWVFDEDPLGWFHWYCRYCAGRRHMRDPHQMMRQIRFITGTNRFRPMAPTPVIKQSLVHWAYDPDKVFP